MSEVRRPQVSIIIPTFRHPDLIRETLDSVFAQTFADYEIIIIEDSSPGSTATSIGPLIEQGRVRYFEQVHTGTSTARNRGLAHARGEFIAFLDDDDLWPADKLAWQVEALRESPNVVLVYGPMTVLGEDVAGPIPDGPSGAVRLKFLEKNWIASPGQTLIRRQALEGIGGFDESLWGADDWDLYLRLARMGEFLYYPRTALRYRIHSRSTSKNILKLYINDCRVQRKHFGAFPRPGNLKLWFACRWYILTFCAQRLVANLRVR